jgi:hypothetical protein
LLARHFRAAAVIELPPSARSVLFQPAHLFTARGINLELEEQGAAKAVK